MIGGGLAGCAVAWQAHFRGLKVLLIDRQDPDSSSRVAAGLVTSITGTRAAASWKWEEFYPVADRFYRQVEHTTGAMFWKVQPALKVYESISEAELYQSRWGDADSNTLGTSPRIYPVDRTSDFAGLRAPLGACMMHPSARLETQKYIQSTHDFFLRYNAMQVVNLDLESEFDSRYDSIVFRSVGCQSACVILCQGVAARENIFFNRLPLHPARGDILQIESKSFRIEHVVHGQGWLVPTDAGRFLVGATYDRNELTTDCSQQNPNAVKAREELMKRWEALVQGSFAAKDHLVLGQRAAVRPASYDRHPLIGQHETIDRMYCMNGLGSKGSLMAPGLANTLLDAIDGVRIPKHLDWKRRK